jgi:uncharacterized protein
LKFQPDTLAGVNSITRHDAHRIQVGAQGFEHSLIIPWRGQVLHWPCANVASLSAKHFEQLLALRPEVVIFGSGAKLQFIAPALYRCLIDQRIGMETMDTSAACRTYNVLAHEGRAVVAALICEPAV